MERLQALAPRLIVYIACAPKPIGEARKVLTEYSLTHVTPFDLFPQTEHVETLAIFAR